MDKRSPILLVTVLSALLAPAQAAQPRQTAAVAAPDTLATQAQTAPQCSATGCRNGDAVWFEVSGLGEQRPAVNGDDDAAWQRNRRVETVTAQLYTGSSQILEDGQASVIGRFSVALPQRGTLWAIEDPTLGEPALNVQAGAQAPFADGRLSEPLRFHAYSNYAAFYQRLQVLIYRGEDADRTRPLAVVDLPAGAVAEARWDGVLPADTRLQPGDELQYIARATAADGSFDETAPRRLQLVSPQDYARGAQQQRDEVQRQTGQVLDTASAQSLRISQAIYGNSGLRIRNIPVYGSRVRILGQDVPEGAQLSIDGQIFPIDASRKFVAEFLQPVGLHRYQIKVSHAQDAATELELPVEVSGRYAFVTALADVTFSRQHASGQLDPLAADADGADGFLSEGRLAFYASGTWQGKYRLTAQADTGESALGDLFDGFLDARPDDIFRRLDPDLYYPTYGDDSTTVRDVNSQGKLYVRLDWQQNRALWGNFSTGFDSVEYAQYQRALYGAALDWRSRGATALGDARSVLKVFGSQAESAPGHSEFLGTGGSLYYLRHTDVLPGSEQVVMEVRDPTTGRVEARVTLKSGIDYEMDDMQGRLILTRPLAQITRENVRTLTRDTPLDGYQQRLLVDYEYVPTGFDSDDVSVGLRGRQWLGDHVAIGATYVDEQRGGQDYDLRGADLTLQAGRGTYLQLEASRSQATAAPIFYSDNGGLSFLLRNPLSGARRGDAKRVEARANFQELGWSQREWTVGAWWRDVDAGFSIARQDTGQALREYGAEFSGQLSDTLTLYGRHSDAERGTQGLRQTQLTMDWQVTDDARLGGEVRRVSDRGSQSSDATLLAASWRQRLGSAWELYGVGQYTADDDDGRYDRNNLLTVGARYLWGDRSSVGAEASSGSRGHGGKLDAEYRLTPDHTLYGAYQVSTDSTRRQWYDSALQSGWTLGQRWRVSNQINVYNESQFIDDTRGGQGLAHTFGLDFLPAPGWTLGFTVMDGEVQAISGDVQRRAYSASGGRTSARTDWASKLEYRRDRGAEQREQWVTTNRLFHRLNDDWRLALRANYADTQDRLNPLADARLAETQVGFAWRPHDSTRWAAFGKYTWLYDLASPGQIDAARDDQRSHVISLEGIVQVNDDWQLAAKLASRRGDYRMGRGQGQWLDSRSDFAALQVRYALAGRWDALAEHRWLRVHDGGTRRGWLVGVDRNLGENLKIGVGYNFTDFSEDLTQLRYEYEGWFLNIAGYY